MGKFRSLWVELVTLAGMFGVIAIMYYQDDIWVAAAGGIGTACGMFWGLNRDGSERFDE